MPLCKPNTTDELHASTIRRVRRCRKTRKKSKSVCTIAWVPSAASTAVSATDTFAARNEHQGSLRPPRFLLVVRGSALGARKLERTETASTFRLRRVSVVEPSPAAPHSLAKAAMPASRKRSDTRIIVPRISALKARRGMCAADPVGTRLPATRWGRQWGHSPQDFMPPGRTAPHAAPSYHLASMVRCATAGRKLGDSSQTFARCKRSTAADDPCHLKRVAYTSGGVTPTTISIPSRAAVSRALTSA